MRIYKRGKSILALTLVLLTLMMLVPFKQAMAVNTQDIPVEISWSGTTDNTLLPASLTVGLTQSGPGGVITNYRTATLKKTDTFAAQWNGSFTNVPDTTVGGTKYTYSVVWPSVTDFSTVASTSLVYGGEAKAQYVYKTTPIPQQYNVELQWAGEPTGSTHRNVIVQLNNAKTATSSNPTITIADPATTGSFAGITGVITAGKPVSISVVDPPAGYVVSYAFDGNDSFTVTLSYNSDFSGTITWLNAPRFNKPGVTITLAGKDSSGNTVHEPQHCFGRTDEDCLSYTVSGLQPDLTYSIKSVAIDKTMADDLSYEDPKWSGNSITIDRKTNALFRIGVHMRWVDNNNKRERRPNETTVYLYRDGAFTGDEAQISESSGWDAIFYDQPYSDGAHVYKYSVRAAKTPYYWSRCTRLSNFGFLVTQFYGTGKSDTDTNSGTTPKVGDPTLFRTAFSDSMYRQAAASMEAVRDVAVLRDNETEAGTVDFDTLKRLNKDVVAWITLSGTDIDYPIVKGTDNTKYLTRLFSGESNSSGSLFMDYRNNSSFGNRNTTVFGHNMKDGSMFSALTDYDDQSFYEAHPSFSIQTPNGSFTAEPIAAFYSDASTSNVVKRTFANNAAFLKYIDKCIRASSIQSNATVSATDKIITFVTCDDDYTANRRFLVVCKLSAD